MNLSHIGRSKQLNKSHHFRKIFCDVITLPFYINFSVGFITCISGAILDAETLHASVLTAVPGTDLRQPALPSDTSRICREPGPPIVGWLDPGPRYWSRTCLAVPRGMGQQVPTGAGQKPTLDNKTKTRNSPWRPRTNSTMMHSTSLLLLSSGSLDACNQEVSSTN